jgi:Protein of unknown function (DUF4031)
MTVYVDDMRMRAQVGTLDRVWCHLFIGPEDEISELHEFAAEIGLPRRWFQGPPKHPWPRSHYDVTEGKRWLAVKAGAVEVTWEETGRMMLAGRARRHARAVELAEGLGHIIERGELKWQCLKCGQPAIHRLRYSWAASHPCPQPRPWHLPPPDGVDAESASAGHMAAVTRLMNNPRPGGDDLHERSG